MRPSIWNTRRAEARVGRFTLYAHAIESSQVPWKTARWVWSCDWPEGGSRGVARDEKEAKLKARRASECGQM